MRTIFFVIIIFVIASCGRNREVYDATGIFEATEIIVSAEASGKLMEFNVSEGQRIPAGEQLGYIDTVQLHLRKKQLLASVDAVVSRSYDVAKQIAAIREEIATMQRERERTEKLIAANAATGKQLDDINSRIAVLEKQLAAQRSTLESGNTSIARESAALEIQVAQIDDQLSKSRITSPIDGTVLVKYAEKGELTATGKPLFKVADTNNMILRAYISAQQLTQLKTGQGVAVFSDYGNADTRRYEGVVTWISDKSEFTPKTIQTPDERVNLVYAIKIAVKNDGLLKIGMYGDVQLKVEN